METCLGTNPSPEAFGRWAKKRNIFLHPDVAFLVPTKTMGAGVFARRALPAGTVIISCPETASLSPYSEPTADSPVVAVLQKAFQQYHQRQRRQHDKRREASAAASEGDAAHPTSSKDAAEADGVLQENALHVILRLMAELCRCPRDPAAHPDCVNMGSNGTTAWRSWLEACPHMSAHLFDLTPAQAAALGLAEPHAPQPAAAATGDQAGADTDTAAAAPSPSWTGVSQQLSGMRLRERWALAKELVVDAHPEHFPPSLATYELFCECAAQVYSRNFHREELPGREGPYLLPGVDIINHAFACNAGFEVKGGGRRYATTFNVVASRPLQRGEQIYCSYGRIGAARFVSEFQFITEAVVREDMCRFSTRVLADMARYLARTLGGDDTVKFKEPLCVVDDREMARRVGRLQGIGLLYDEGLYLSRPFDDADEARDSAIYRSHHPTLATEVAVTGTTRHAQDVHRTAEERRLDCQRNLRVFAVVLYLLTASTAHFDAVYHDKLSREWEAPRTPAVRTLVLKALEARHDAAATQDAAVDDLFPVDEAAEAAQSAPAATAASGKNAAKAPLPPPPKESDNAVRRRILHGTLRSEMEAMNRYKKMLLADGAK